MDTIWHDVRFALRTLAKRPAFTVVTLLTLALGIGATTTIFGLVDAVLLEALPYEEPERLLAVFDEQPGFGKAPASYPEYLDWKQNTGQFFEEVATFFNRRVNFSGDGRPVRLDAARVSANLLPTLGIRPMIGRGFTPDDEPVGAAPVVLIGYSFWQSRLGGAADAVGRVLRLDGESTTVVGVLPPAARDCLPMDQAGGPGRELWLPLRIDTEGFPRGLHFMNVLGRLAPGITRDQAAREIGALSTHLQEEVGSDHGIRLSNLAQEIVSEARPRLLALMGAVGLVLLIGCANVANLLLARATARRREISVRMAVGASRGRLIRQLVTESLLLAVAGGALGVAAAAASLRWFAAIRIADLPRAGAVELDLSVLGFAVLVTLLTAVLFGLAPALQSASAHLADAFRDAGQGGSGRGAQRLRGGLVVGEVALSLMLLVAAGLLLRSFVRLTEVDLGFEPDGRVTSGFLLPEAQYPDDEARVRFFDRALESLRAIPGVEGAALVNALPVLGGPNGSFEIEGQEWPDGQSPYTEKRRVSTEYFQVMGIPLERGRSFTEQDAAGGTDVVVVNREFVRRFLPDGDPIGRRIDFGWNVSSDYQEIVGVVGDVQHRSLDQGLEPAMYVPYRQNAQFFMQAVLRTDLASRSLEAAVRREIAAIDPDLPVTEVRPMKVLIGRTLAQPRLATGLLGGFATAALLLAMLGIYGVMSYSAAQRTQEMGIRMALGAGRRKILVLVVRQGMKLTVAGAAVGVLGALALTRYLEASLFHVEATDPLTFLVVVPVLLLVAAAACVMPARRAARVDPVVALRSE